MTPEQFANKYLSKPDAQRYFINISKSARYRTPLDIKQDSSFWSKYSYISNAFTWSSTPEGHDYWQRIAYNVQGIMRNDG